MIEKPHDHPREARARVAGGDGGGAWMRGDGGHEKFLVDGAVVAVAPISVPIGTELSTPLHRIEWSA
jgi:hypothetical protein